MTRGNFATAVPSIVPTGDELAAFATIVERADIETLARLNRLISIELEDRIAGRRSGARPATQSTSRRQREPPPRRVRSMEDYPVEDLLKPGQAAKIAKCHVDTIKKWVREEGIGWISATGQYTVCRPLLMDRMQSRLAPHRQ